MIRSPDIVQRRSRVVFVVFSKPFIEKADSSFGILLGRRCRDNVLGPSVAIGDALLDRPLVRIERRSSMPSNNNTAHKLITAHSVSNWTNSTPQPEHLGVITIKSRANDERIVVHGLLKFCTLLLRFITPRKEKNGWIQYTVFIFGHIEIVSIENLAIHIFVFNEVVLEAVVITSLFEFFVRRSHCILKYNAIYPLLMRSLL
ncbi:hypothetical protein [Adlercreutzia caecimuris]|uniref:hypothetical protein n=1 Tax=Adlercreutzia caecimuris TaxID=671266 RepID=UPI00272D9D9E|nr:hypothetical protein [Adlercreutzia caecimuris]